MPLLSTPSPGSPAENLSAHGSRPHLRQPQTGGSWGPSNSAKGHIQKLAAHRGYFGHRSSHLPGQKAEELAHKQSSQKQPPALLSPRADSGADLPSSKHLDALPQGPPSPWQTGDGAFLPAGGDRGTVSASPPPQGPAGELHSTISLGSIRPCHPGQEVSTRPASHPGLAAAPSICSPKVSSPLPSALQPHASVNATFLSLLLPTVGFISPWGVPPCRLPIIGSFDTGVQARPMPAGDTDE